MKLSKSTCGIIFICAFACGQAAISLRCKSHCENNEETDYSIKGRPYACNCEVVRTNDIKHSQKGEAPVKSIHKRSTSDEDNEDSGESKRPNIFRLRSRNLDPSRNFNLLDMSTKNPILEKIMEKFDELKLGKNSEESLLGSSLLDYKGLMPSPISLPPLEDIFQKHAEIVSPRTKVLENLRSHVDNWMDRFDKSSFTPNIPSFSDLEQHVNKINLNMRMDGSNPLLKPNWGLVGADNPLSKFSLLPKFKETHDEEEFAEESNESDKEEKRENNEEEEENKTKDTIVEMEHALKEETTTVKAKLYIKTNRRKVDENVEARKGEEIQTTIAPTNSPATKKPIREGKKKLGSIKRKPKEEDGGEPIVIPHVPGIIVQPKEFMGEDNP